jgi:tRNA A-37 threonylcarbamoyl transferase component Bud32
MGCVLLRVPWSESRTNNLTAIHTRGILHGDICPENILIKGVSSVVLIDFERSEVDTDTALLAEERKRGHVSIKMVAVKQLNLRTSEKIFRIHHFISMK